MVVNANVGGSGANPSVHFGHQVRKQRKSHGWSIHELSRRAGINAGYLSMIENGKRPPNERTAAKIDAVFPERDGWFTEFYEDSQEWAPPGYRNWYEYENATHTLRCWVGGVVHGLAQTPEYARAHLQTVPDVPADVVAARLKARMERQQRLLKRAEPTEVWFLVDELSLYRQMGTPDVMAGQCDHLVNLGTMPDVTVLVVPAVGHPGANAEITVADTAAYTEHMLSGYTFIEPETVTALGRLIVRLQTECFRASESADIIRRVGELWRTGVSPVLALRRADRASK